METFLKLVAEDLYHKLDGDLSHTAIVFPNKRAGLFFNEYLSACSGQPVWAPAYVTISELYRHLSPTEQVADSIKLVCELYKSFVTATHSAESLDKFYFWGELLLSDFDDVDKNMADANRLFGNLKDLKNIGGNDFLTPEQEAAIKQFFQNFSIEKQTKIKERFIELWNVLGDIYHDFRNRLQEQHLAYEGMLYRNVAENFDAARLPHDRYVFVGFNVLNRVETTLFEKVQEAGKALFYFDYDEFYLKKNHEAGTFILQDLKKFPNELPPEHYQNFSKPKQICFIASPTENGQARYLPFWLKETLGEDEKENAVVLCNESLLQPVIHSLGEDVQRVNVTMGFPLMQTPVYSFVSNLFELQTIGYDGENGRYAYAQVASILKHPYVQMLSAQDFPETANTAEKLLLELTNKNRFYPLPSELQRGVNLTCLFTPQTNNHQLCLQILDLLERLAAIVRTENKTDDFFSQLYAESLFKTYTLIGRINSLTEQEDLRVSHETLWRLITNILSSTSIPFHGEPAVGLQVMGVLETRNLDFKNLIMLSLNEGKLPQKNSESSFIPYNLRKAFGLTTIEKQIAVYAYYFYRLMQRAENITLMYNNSPDGLNQGEMSRFMLQLLIESPHRITKYALQATQLSEIIPIPFIKKTKETQQKLLDIFDQHYNKKAYFSPTALNTYLDCKLKFYFKYVVGLRAKEEVSTEIDSAVFGSIFHKVAETIYNDFKQLKQNQAITASDLENLLKDNLRIERMTDNAFKEEFFKIPLDCKPEYNGLQLINRAVIISYIRQLLQKDLIIARQAPFIIQNTEDEVYEILSFTAENHEIQTKIGGKIDREDIVLDKTNAKKTLRIVDYKTGGEPQEATSVEELFLPSKKRQGYIFQTFLYSTIVLHKPHAGDVRYQAIAPSLLYIHKASQEEYSPVIRINKAEVHDFSQYDGKFRELLINLLQEIFDSTTDFTPTDIADKCVYCDFKQLCHR